MSNALVKDLKKKYNFCKSAKVGSVCICPSCSVSFTKENYQQAFCKTKQGTSCKDFYWNNVTPGKRNNTTRISPANADRIRERGWMRDEFADFNDDDPSWDSHKTC